MTRAFPTGNVACYYTTYDLVDAKRPCPQTTCSCLQEDSPHRQHLAVGVTVCCQSTGGLEHVTSTLFRKVSPSAVYKPQVAVVDVPQVCLSLDMQSKQCLRIHVVTAVQKFLPLSAVACGELTLFSDQLAYACVPTST